MARTLRERWREEPVKQAVEQFGHLVGIAAAPVALVFVFVAWAPPAWPIWAGLSAGVWIASVREFVDGLPVESWGDAALDWAFSVLGPVLVGLGFWVAVF